MPSCLHANLCCGSQEGDLDSAIKKYKGYLPEEDIMLKFVQIALALHYTHSKVWIHSLPHLLCIHLGTADLFSNMHLVYAQSGIWAGHRTARQSYVMLLWPIPMHMSSNCGPAS